MDIGTTKMIARKEVGIGWMIFNQPEKHNAVSYDMWLAVPRTITGAPAASSALPSLSSAGVACLLPPPRIAACRLAHVGFALGFA